MVYFFNLYDIIFFKGGFTLRVFCERLDDYGRGIVFLDKICFVPGLLPLEEADIEIVLNKKKYMIGKVISIISESPYRVSSLCPYDSCGCALKNLAYDKTLEFKLNKVRSILSRFASLDNVVSSIVKSDNVNFYRNKVTLKVNHGVGYFKNNSNDFLGISSCFIAKKVINDIIGVLNTLDLSGVHEITIKAYDEVMIVIDGVLDFSVLKDYASSIYMNGNLVYGKRYVLASISSFRFYVGPEAFFQINDNMTLKLYEKVSSYLSGDTVLDLFCGTGTISLFLSKYFSKVIGVEINEDAVSCANMNKELNKVSNVSFICGDVSDILPSLKASSLVVDPPRAGLSKEAVLSILKIGPDRIVYVSCDPVTLARDLSLLKEDYEVLDVTLFDMFPNTYHVESVAVLERKAKK